ncbi:hypothetical protein CCFV1_ORF032 [Cotesia congregata filamentous virus 1]|uniref:C2H2-type domain-containing protein n=1 Tax=Cotesia congregata filamentous virus 1 TaxID=3064291 RepID=A0ABC8QN77_9VIRU|nr:hypothetical protein CCFV1_ORF032 [Cotesia congregata filamentous virus 1]
MCCGKVFASKVTWKRHKKTRKHIQEPSGPMEGDPAEVTSMATPPTEATRAESPNSINDNLLYDDIDRLLNEAIDRMDVDALAPPPAPAQAMDAPAAAPAVDAPAAAPAMDALAPAPAMDAPAPAPAPAMENFDNFWIDWDIFLRPI